MKTTHSRRKIVVAVWLLSAFLVSLARSSASVSYAQSGNPGQAAVPDRVLVKFRDGTSAQRVAEVLASVGAVSSREIPRTGIYVVELPTAADEETCRQVLESQPEAAFAELDAVLEPAQLTPDDPLYPSQYHLPIISAPGAWSTTTGSSDVIIAILDTGVDGTHPDLAPKMVAGWNFFDGNNDTSDVHGHGTRVAGAAAAIGNNAIGVASPAWGCRIMPIRISAPDGGASTSTMAEGLIFAADNGARVANISYQATNFSVIASAAQYFQNRGGVVTIASGNTGTFDPSPDNPYVLTVTATTSIDVLAGFSTTGNNVDISAPGSGILTTTAGGGYGFASGTSFSAPVAAGVAALVMSASPSLSGPQVQSILRLSGDDLGPTGFDTGFGWGRVNANRAVAFASQQQVPKLGAITAPTEPIQAGTTFGAGAEFIDGPTNDSHTAIWYWGDGTNSAGVVDENSFSVSGSHAYASAGVHTVTLILSDSLGQSDQTFFEFVVVFDPNGGYVTGVGTITSPPGAYAVDPLLTGKASFGFSAKYQRGANEPTGHTRFQFRVADLSFRSTSYQWLVVAGQRAQFKGLGEINGVGGYSFMLTAIDGDIPGGPEIASGGAQSPDRFRIKIIDLNGGQVIYDNQRGSPDFAEPTTYLESGRITIQE